jgi:predicted transcriptional regulator
MREIIMDEISKQSNDDDIDGKIISYLTNLGMAPHIAKTLTFISQVDECCSTEIENGVNLRQPEVSLAMKSLEEKGWVKKRHIKQEGKGRPTHYYRLSKNFTDIIDTIVGDKVNEINEEKENITKLRSIISESY